MNNNVINAEKNRKNPILFNSQKWGEKLTVGGGKVDVVSLSEIFVPDYDENNEYNKSKEPWVQMFNTGYRVDKYTIEWDTWNGCVFVDIDSKKVPSDIKFDFITLENKLDEYFTFEHESNYLALQRSFSNKSYHILFYFDVPKNETNFLKCCQLATYFVMEGFERCGYGQLLKYKGVVDACSEKYAQIMYVSKNKMHIAEPTGRWPFYDEIDKYVLEEKVKASVDRVTTHAVDFEDFEYEPINDNKRKTYYEHHQRWKIYNTLIACYGTEEKTNEVWVNNIVPNLAEGNHHDMRFYIEEPRKNGWFGRYMTEHVNEKFLEPFGFKFKKKFVEAEIDDFYKADVVIELKEDENLSDVKIPFMPDRINHLYAGCGVGKTYMAKELGKYLDDLSFIFGEKKRVCFISPLKSIIKNSFDSMCVKGWDIVDSDHKGVKDIEDILRGQNNICTTWESFVIHKMNEILFDYVILDEAHSLYMYDYRLNGINMIKKTFRTALGTKVLMTGTPSYEVEDFDCYKIKVVKKQPLVKCEMLAYNEQYWGHIIEDIKEWTKEENNIALIFYDTTNYRLEDKFARYGLNIDIFCQNNEDATDYILTNNDVRDKITGFSVFGQAGINLYISGGKKARVYILNKNALGIIQYANRIRNKECIDKVIIPVKNDFDLNVNALDITPDLCDAERRMKSLRLANKREMTDDMKSIIKHRLGFPADCIYWPTFDLIEENYRIYKEIEGVGKYESQIQMIIKRLQEAYFDCNFTYLENDTPLQGDTNMRANQFAGQMLRFNFDMVRRYEDKLFIEMTQQFKKIVTGDFKDVFTKFLNYLYDACGGDMNKTEELFNNIRNEIINANKTIKKTDFEIFNLYYKLIKNWSDYYNTQFVSMMLDERWDNIKLTAVYMRTIYDAEMGEEDWKMLAEESYSDICKLRKAVQIDPTVFIKLEEEHKSEVIHFENDDIMGKIHSYLLEQHSRGKKTKNTKEITVKGQIFSSVNDAAKYFGVSRKTISKWINQ